MIHFKIICRWLFCKTHINVLYLILSDVLYMKILHISLTVILFVIILNIMPESVLGLDHCSNSEKYPQNLESIFGNSNTTELVYNDSKVVLEQTIQKTTYKIKENITVARGLVNMGNQNVTIYHWNPVILTEAKYDDGNHAWPPDNQGGFVLGANALRNETLKPQILNSVNTLPVTLTLYYPGNYTVISMAWIKFNSSNTGRFNGMPLWSKPLQITVLPEKYVQNETNSSVSKIPEFPLAIPILLIGIMSILVFYRMKSSSKFRI